MKRQAVAVGTDGCIVASGEFDTDDIVVNPDGSYTVTVSRVARTPTSGMKMIEPWVMPDA